MAGRQLLVLGLCLAACAIPSILGKVYLEERFDGEDQHDPRTRETPNHAKSNHCLCLIVILLFWW